MEFVGVDISKYSLELANRYFSRTNLKFVSSLDQMESFAFDLIIANMSLMDTEDLDQNLSSLSRLLVENGRFFIIITHPSFWPLYWDYANNATFKYTQQHKITKEYKTKNKTFSGFQTTHFHRPLSSYINGLIRYSFKLQEMRELQGKNDIEWYSRFLYLEFIKERTD
jgi:ubiquinone/menaquinone biosynthesis C-methylase UbiE